MTQSAPGSASWWDDRYAGAELLWSLTPNRFVVEETGDLPAGRALDLACGEGRNAIWLAGRGWQVTGVDFSPVALGKARDLADRAGAQVQWIEADVLTPGPEVTEAQPYELVLLAYLHLPKVDRQRALTVAAEATAPNGSLLLIGHDRRNLVEGTGGPQDPDLLWTPDEVVRAGFSPVRSGTVARPVDELTALDTVVRLVRTG